MATTAGDDATKQGSRRRLSWPERRLLVLLGLPSLGLAYTVTVTSTYVPVLVAQTSGPLMVGLLVGGEGFFGLFVPLLVGSWADRSRVVSGRLRWLGGGSVLLVAAAGAVGLLGLFSVGVWGFGVALSLLYIGYYAYLGPYWALYPDLVPHDQSGRSRSAESTWRVIGVGLALIGGGFLLSVSRGLPFFVAGVFVVLVTVVLLYGLRGRRKDAVEEHGQGREDVSGVRELLRDLSIRRLVVANSLWNLALSAVRAFVVLFFTMGLGKPPSFVSSFIFPLAAVGIGVAAPASGWLADRFGHVRLLTAALVVYGGTMWIPGVFEYPWEAVLIPIVAAGAATVMTLPLAVLMRLLPDDKHGAASGLFGLSRGIGGTFGPLLAGAAIMLLRHPLASTHGYGALWFVGSAALLVSIVFLRGLAGDDRL